MGKLTVISEETRYNILIDYIQNGLSVRDILKKYNLKSKYFINKVIGKENIRSISDAVKLVHIKKPNLFFHTELTKEKIRNKRLLFMKEHPDKTAWRMSNLSYIEYLFEQLIKDNKLDTKYLIYREYSVFPYYIDFAFIDIKVAVELDGSQHMLPERKEKDYLKDQLLIDNGWRVLRITAKEILTNYSNVIDILNEFIGNAELTFSLVGLMYKIKTREKAERDKDGYTEKLRLLHINNRKVKDRPDKDTLLLLIKNNSFIHIGQIYGVSDNTIRKWCKYYGLPYKRIDIDNL